MHVIFFNDFSRYFFLEILPRFSHRFFQNSSKNFSRDCFRDYFCFLLDFISEFSTICCQHYFGFYLSILSVIISQFCLWFHLKIFRNFFADLFLHRYGDFHQNSSRDFSRISSRIFPRNFAKFYFPETIPEFPFTILSSILPEISIWTFIQRFFLFVQGFC